MLLQGRVPQVYLIKQRWNGAWLSTQALNSLSEHYCRQWCSKSLHSCLFSLLFIKFTFAAVDDFFFPPMYMSRKEMSTEIILQHILPKRLKTRIHLYICEVFPYRNQDLAGLVASGISQVRLNNSDEFLLCPSKDDAQTAMIPEFWKHVPKTWH